MTTKRDTSPRTTTDLAIEISTSPRFRNCESSYFEELAAKYGEDFTGVAFMQALLKVAQER